VNLHTLPKTNPLTRQRTEAFRRFVSPLQRIAWAHQDVQMDGMEIIQPFAVTPWEERIQTMIQPERERAVETANATEGMLASTSSSERNGKIGMGGVTWNTLLGRSIGVPYGYSVTLGARTEQNPYTAELAAIAKAMADIVETMRGRPHLFQGRQITVFSSNQTALLSVSQPKQLSGQTSIRQIYDATRSLRERGNQVLMVWVPRKSEFELGKRAKAAAQQATKQECPSPEQRHRVKSTTLSSARANQRNKKVRPEGISRYSREMDTALPGKHTRMLYDGLKRKEANVLAQLRTGMARLNGYLYRIGAAESDQCACGEAKETVKHFLFRCSKWTRYREGMLQQTDTLRGNLSFYLGGRSPSDNEPWTPSMDAVRATVKYAISTGRLETEMEQLSGPSQQ
jgi:ribonuclease HI